MFFFFSDELFLAVELADGNVFEQVISSISGRRSL